MVVHDMSGYTNCIVGIGNFLLCVCYDAAVAVFMRTMEHYPRLPPCSLCSVYNTYIFLLFFFECLLLFLCWVNAELVFFQTLFFRCCCSCCCTVWMPWMMMTMISLYVLSLLLLLLPFYMFFVLCACQSIFLGFIR